VDRRYEKYARDVPVMPAVAAKVLGFAAASANVSFRSLEDIVKVDQGLTARILKVANSAQYARQRQIKDLTSAFTLLGFNTIKSLVLVVTASGMFSSIRSSAFYRDHWYHSILTSFLAKALAVRCALREIAEETFLAGLFHDIGRVPLYLSDPARYDGLVREEIERGAPMRELERQAFGTDHQELGADLLTQWAFPAVYVDTAREHDSSSITSAHKSVIVLVTVSNILVDRAVTGKTVPHRQELLAKLLGYTCLTPEEADGYTVGLPQILAPDPLFAQCMEIYGFGATPTSAPG